MNPTMMSAAARLEIILGPMFSGKSTEMLRRIRRYKQAGQKCGVVKYDKDTRYSIEDFATHDGSTHPAIPCSNNLSSVRERVSQYSVIGIDEGQFFTDIVSFVIDMLSLGKIVIIAALDGDYKQESFGSVLQLIPKCDSVVKLNAVCTLCQKDASFTCRKTQEDTLEVIGGDDKYMALCRQCWIESSS